jgi:DNA repair ATPase RecN
MLTDRTPSVESLHQLADQVISSAEDDEEKKMITSQISDLEQRWEKLNEVAELRQKDLQDISGVARLFREKILPIMEWLDKTEKLVSGMDSISADPEQLQKLIEEHKVSFIAFC